MIDTTNNKGAPTTERPSTPRLNYSKAIAVTHIVLDALAIAMLLVLALQIGGAL